MSLGLLIFAAAIALVLKVSHDQRASARALRSDRLRFERYVETWRREDGS